VHYCLLGSLSLFFNSPLNRCGCSVYILADEHINQREVLSRIIGINGDLDLGLCGEVVDRNAGLVCIRIPKSLETSPALVLWGVSSVITIRILSMGVPGK
jgi:hypothetical protein